MRLDTFLLAEAASASVQDGKLYVHGGGLTRVTAPTLPFVLPQLAVAARFLVEDDEELSQSHQFRISLNDPDGSAVIPPIPVQMEPGEPVQLPDGEERFVQFAMTFGGVVFARAGIYSFSLVLDDIVQREMTLPVVALTAEELGAIMQPRPAPPPAPNRAQRRAKKR
jgi:hypothetical protein